jgi:hypothetical protein
MSNWIWLPPAGDQSRYFGDPVDTVGDLPATGNTGEIRVVVDTGIIYYWDGNSWEPISSSTAITALTGDVTATGPGSVPATLATVNPNVGSFGSATQVATVTFDGKGRATAAANVSIQLGSSAAVTGLDAQLAAKAATASPTFTGTVTLSNGALRLANLTEVQRDALTPAAGMMIFNTDTNRFQGYFSGAWGDLHGWGS